MIRFHLSDGQTVAVDLSDASEAEAWLRRLQTTKGQAEVSGVTVVESHPVRALCPGCGSKHQAPFSGQLSTTRPVGFRNVQLVAEDVEPEGRAKGGQRVTYYCDDVRLVVMAHAEQPAARVTLAKVGVRRFDPATRKR